MHIVHQHTQRAALPPTVPAFVKLPLISKKLPINVRGGGVSTWRQVGGAGSQPSGPPCCIRHTAAMAASAQRISNSFLTSPKPTERIWLIVLNYLLPPETRSIWGHGAFPAHVMQCSRSYVHRWMLQADGKGPRRSHRAVNSAWVLRP